MKKVAVCTIIAKNYIALAKTLGDSLKAFHSITDFHVLVIDLFDMPFIYLELDQFILGLPTDLSTLSTEKFQQFACEYNLLELSTALKPFYLEHLLLQGYDKVIYLDPDILILQPLDHIFQALDTSNIVITPHLLDPIPLDDFYPNEINMLLAGTYNLGFIGVAQSQETHRFLTWWGERLERYCVTAPSEGLFVDQKWIDLVPGLFEKVQILTARGYNVAYWNLNARHLSERDNIYWVNNEPVVFFHFSGFNADSPTELSKHQNRLKVETLPTLAKLLQHYADLLKVNGRDEYKSLPYGYATFSNGVPIDKIVRFLLRFEKKLGVLFPNPLNVDAEPSFFAWLNSPIKGIEQPVGSPQLTNYLAGLYMKHLELQKNFPDVGGKDRDDYLSWIDTKAAQLGIHSAYLGK